eukprot:SAG31_NODE_389_length_16370_cov_4.517915_5_plen_193_part_00
MVRRTWRPPSGHLWHVSSSGSQVPTLYIAMSVRTVTIQRNATGAKRNVTKVCTSTCASVPNCKVGAPEVLENYGGGRRPELQSGTAHHHSRRVEPAIALRKPWHKSQRSALRTARAGQQVLSSAGCTGKKGHLRPDGVANAEKNLTDWAAPSAAAWVSPTSSSGFLYVSWSESAPWLSELEARLGDPCIAAT